MSLRAQQVVSLFLTFEEVTMHSPVTAESCQTVRADPLPCLLAPILQSQAPETSRWPTVTSYASARRQEISFASCSRITPAGQIQHSRLNEYATRGSGYGNAAGKSITERRTLPRTWRTHRYSFTPREPESPSLTE